MAVEFGFSNYIQRETAVDSQNLLNELNTALTIKFILFFLFFGVVIIYNRGNNWINTIQIVFLIFTFYISSVNNLLSRLFYGYNKYDRVFKLFFIARIIFVLEIVKGFLFDFSLTEIFIILFLSNLMILIQFIYASEKATHKLRLIHIKSGVLKKILYSSLPIGIGIFFVWVYDRVDVLLIQGYLGDALVSFYTVAYSLYKLPQIFAGILLVPLFTDLSKEYKLFNGISLASIKSPIIILSILSVLSIIISIFFSEKGLPLIYSQKYVPSVGILNLLIIAIPGLLLNNTSGVILNSCRKEKIPMYATLFGLILNVSINILCISKMKLLAPVLATIATEYFILIIQTVFILKYKLIDFHNNLKLNT